MSVVSFESGVQRELRNEWLALRDDASPASKRAAASCVRFAHRAGFLSADEEELWLRRLTTCPGHDDEGGRDWCAYCGRIDR